MVSCEWLTLQIALLEEQKKESPEEHNDESVEADTNPKVDSADGKPDINDVPMEEKEVTWFICLFGY